MKKLTYLFVAGVLSFFTVSCDKNDTVDQQTEEATTVVTDENTTNVDASETDAIIDESFTLAASTQLRSATIADTLTYLNAGCPTITLDTISATKILTIDFGSSCTGKDGKVRSGKIIVKSSSFSKTNVARRITFDKYTVDNKQIAGSIYKVITYKLSGNRQAVVKDSLTFTFPGKGTATRYSDQTRVYAYNQMKTWGTVQFTGVKGNTVTKTVDAATPLVYKMLCRHIVSGIQVITFNNKKTVTIDYGDGTCDRKAIATDGTKTWEIKL